MNKRVFATVAFGVFTAAAILVCIRLGIWQLDRLDERRALNAAVRAQAELPPASVAELSGADSAAVHWRRVSLRAQAHYDREMVLAARAQAGAPGVHLVTPVSLIGEELGDTLVLLLRGFVYAPDGRTIDHVAAREGDTLDVEGLAMVFPTPRDGLVRLSGEPPALRMLNRDTISALLEAPVAPFVVLVLGDTIPKSLALPARIPPPSLSEGPHFSYALQWFGFALVFALGYVAYVMNRRQGMRRNRAVGNGGHA